MRLFLILLITIFSLSIGAESNDHSIASFERLKTLYGKWKKEGSDGKDFYISFEGSANGSVVIENWMYKGVSHSLTVYHLDGKALLATHYCPQGNQPRLRLENSNDENVLPFVFQDATNLESLDDNHQHSLSFELLTENMILRKESYSESGKITPSTLRLIRR